MLFRDDWNLDVGDDIRLRTQENRGSEGWSEAGLERAGGGTSKWTGIGRNWGNNETMLNSLRTKKVLTEKHQEKTGRAGNAVLGRRLRFSES